jgi:hypothetical protein
MNRIILSVSLCLYTKSQVNGFAHHIHKSSTLHVAFHRLRDTCKASIPTKQELPTKYVSTRWNSQLDSAESHRDLRPPIEMMTANSEYKLTRYKLTDPQWKLLNELCECLPVRIFVIL